MNKNKAKLKAAKDGEFIYQDDRTSFKGTYIKTSKGQYFEGENISSPGRVIIPTQRSLQKNLLLNNMIKKNQTDVASAWSNYQSNKSLLDSVRAQVNAAEIANEGIVDEYNSVADRTTLEVIQSNSLLLNAQISLADSERNYILSQFNLLKSIGLLNSEYLKLR